MAGCYGYSKSNNARDAEEDGRCPATRLTTPMDANGKPIRIPSDGLVLSRKLAEVLTQRATRIAAGDPVEVHGQAISDGPINGRVLRVCPAGFKKISSLGVEQQRVKVAVKLDRPPQRLGVGFRVYEEQPHGRGGAAYAA